MAYTKLVPQKITSTNDTEIATPSSFPNIKSLLLANVSGAAVVVDLYYEYVTATTGTITDTGTNVNEGSGEAVSLASVVVTVDGTAPTNDVFLNKKVYKSDATFFGTCTAFVDSSTDTITFGGGLESAMADDDDLYTSTKYYIIKNVGIPVGAVLKLDGNEINFDQGVFALYINCSAANAVDVITKLG